MANFTFNQGKGRVVQLVKNVDAATPANAAILLVVLSASDTFANVGDFDTLTAVLAGTPNEVGAAWGASNGRKTLTASSFAGTDYGPDDTNDWGFAKLPSQTWATVAASNNSTGLLVCYTETASPTDSDWIPLTHHDFAVTTDGSNVVLDAGDFFRGT